MSMRLGRKKITVYSLQKTRLHHWVGDRSNAELATSRPVSGGEGGGVDLHGVWNVESGVGD